MVVDGGGCWWMDGRGVSATDLQTLCPRLAQEVDFAARLNAQARQAAASRAWAAIERFYPTDREQRPGKKGYPRYQRDCRSVEDTQTGWQLDAEGKRLTLTDGGGIGQVRLIGSRELATFPREQIKRVRLLRRADGSYAQFVLQVERRIEHVPTGSAAGIDMSLVVFGLIAVWYVAPNLRPLPLRTALPPLLLLNVIRVTGLALLVPQVVDPRLPSRVNQYEVVCLRV
jgi:putative transposase